MFPFFGNSLVANGAPLRLWLQGIVVIQPPRHLAIHVVIHVRPGDWGTMKVGNVTRKGRHYTSQCTRICSAPAETRRRLKWKQARKNKWHILKAGDWYDRIGWCNASHVYISIWSRKCASRLTALWRYWWGPNTNGPWRLFVSSSEVKVCQGHLGFIVAQWETEIDASQFFARVKGHLLVNLPNLRLYWYCTSKPYITSCDFILLETSALDCFSRHCSEWCYLRRPNGPRLHGAAVGK